jgi:hypothetical protein
MAWSDSLPDSPIEIRTICPGCAPELDPEHYVAFFCMYHTPYTGGSAGALAKAAVGDDSLVAGEAGGEGNRAFYAAIHHGTRR